MTLNRQQIRDGAAALVAAIDDIGLLNEKIRELELDHQEALGGLRLLTNAVDLIATNKLDRATRTELERAMTHARTILAWHPGPELEAGT